MLKKSESGRNVLEMIAIIVLMTLLIALGLWGFKKASLSAKINTMSKDMSTAITERRYQIAQGGTSKKHTLDTTVGSTDMVIENKTDGLERGQFTILLTDQGKDVCEEMKKFNVFNYNKVLINGSEENDCAQINAMEFYFDGANGGGGNGGGEVNPLSGLKCSAGSVVSCVYGQYKSLYETLADGKQCYKCENCPTVTCPDNCTCGTDPTTGCPTETPTSCTCPALYSETSCTPGINYLIDEKELGGGLKKCYQCETCTTPICPANSCCSDTTDATTGCPTKTPHTCSCAIDAPGYVASCGAGQYITETKTLDDHTTKCYKCGNCATPTCPANSCCSDTTDTITGCPTKTPHTCSCAIDAPGYVASCGAGQYITETKTLDDHTTKCYKCSTCPTVTCPTGCTCSTDSITGCPTSNASSCSCPAGYSTTACISGTNYQTASTTLANGTTCYQCTSCPSSSCPTGKCCTDTTDAHGCPKKTETSCSCPVGYSTTACVSGTNYQTASQTLTDGTTCYKCTACPTGESAPTSGCYNTVKHTGTNGCPDYYTYTTKACCPSSESKPTSGCYDTVNHPAAGGCPAYTTYTPKACTCIFGKTTYKDGDTVVQCGLCSNGTISIDSTKVATCKVCNTSTWKLGNAKNGSNNQDGKCCVNGKLAASATYCPLPCTFGGTSYDSGKTVQDCGKCTNGTIAIDSSKVTTCHSCNNKTWKLSTSSNGTSCGTCGKCSNGSCINNSQTTTIKKYNGNCCVSQTVSYCGTKPSDECTANKKQCRDSCGAGSHCDTSKGKATTCTDLCTNMHTTTCNKGYKESCYQGSCSCVSTSGRH